MIDLRRGIGERCANVLFTDVGEVAGNFGSACASCKHFQHVGDADTGSDDHGPPAADSRIDGNARETGQRHATKVMGEALLVKRRPSVAA